MKWIINDTHSGRKSHIFISILKKNKKCEEKKLEQQKIVFGAHDKNLYTLIVCRETTLRHHYFNVVCSVNSLFFIFCALCSCEIV